MRRPLLQALALLFLTGPTLLAGCPAPAVVVPGERDHAAADEAILAASGLPETLSEPLASDPTRTTIHRLSNGMTVYVSPDPAAARVSAWVAVRAGSMHDPPDSTGLAHYLEHMLFKGTDRLGTLDFEAERPWLEKIAGLYDELRAATDASGHARVLEEIDQATAQASAYAVPGDFDRLYATLGIVDVNAFTTNDATVYHCSVPLHRLFSWARVEADRFSTPTFRLFYPELESVYEEKNISFDSPEDIVWQAVMRGVFGGHPYGSHTTLGDAEHLRTPAYSDMVAQFDRFYQPNNMAIAIVGDVRAAEVLPILEQTFGQTLAPQAVPEATTDSIAHVPGRTFVEVLTTGGQGVTVAWPTVPASHPDTEGLQLLDALMVNGASGLLEVNLELPQVVPTVYSYASELTAGGLFAIEADTRADQDLAEIESLLLREVERIKAGEFDATDVEIAQRHLERAELYALESPDGRAERLLDAFTGRKEWRAVVAATGRRNAMTKDDLVALARRTFGPDFTVVHWREGTPPHPRLAQPKPTPLTANPSQRSAFAKEVLARPSPPPKPKFLQENRDFDRLRTGSGPLVSAKNTRNSLFSLTYRFDIGRRVSPLLCHAFDVLSRSGTKKRTAAERVRALAALGASARFSCDVDSASISLTGLNRTFDAALALAHAWIDNAVIDPEVLARVTANSLARRADWTKDPEVIASALYQLSLRGENSPWRVLPTNRAIKEASADELLAAVHGLLAFRRTTLYYGPRDADALTSVTGWRRPQREAPRPTRDVFTRADRNRVLVVDQPTAKASVYLFFPGAPLPNDDRGAADIFEQYLDADTSALVYQELRERRGLVYTSSSWFNEPELPGGDVALSGYFASSNDRLRTATGVMLETLRRPPTAEGITLALAGRRDRLRLDRVKPRAAPFVVADWLRAGFDEDPDRHLWDRLSVLDPTEVTRVAQARTTGAYTLAIVGDVAEMGDLSALGEVTQLTPSALFGFGELPPA